MIHPPNLTCTRKVTRACNGGHAVDVQSYRQATKDAVYQTPARENAEIERVAAGEHAKSHARHQGQH
jgi:hypothetical protein